MSLSGSVHQVKEYYFKKHRANRYMVEVSVLPPGLAIKTCDHFHDSKADIYNFWRQESFHDEKLENIPSESNIKIMGR